MSNSGGAVLRDSSRINCEFFQNSNNDSICVAICQAISTIEGDDVENLDLMLYDHFDVEALETLVTNTSPTTEWEFSTIIDNYHITIRNDGEVIVEVVE